MARLINKTRKYFISHIFIAAFLFFTFIPGAMASVLFLSPQTGELYTGDTFIVEIKLDAQKENINAIEADMVFPPEILEAVDINIGGSILSHWIEYPDFSNQKGLISLSGGLPFPGFNGDNGLLASVTFKTKKQGEAIIAFQDSSQILLNDGQGGKASLALSGGHYKINSIPEKLPKIFSSTHPDPAKWYSQNTLKITWSKLDTAIYSYILDRYAFTVPDEYPEDPGTSKAYSDIGEGVWYFHLKTKYQGEWLTPAHFRIQIDTEPPLSFEPRISQSDSVAGGQHFISFNAIDKTSGVDYYEVSEKEGHWVIAQSPYILKSKEIDEYFIRIKAIDKAGNLQEEFISYAAPTIHKKNLFLRLLGMSVLLLIICVVIIIYILRKKRIEKNLRKKRKMSEK